MTPRPLCLALLLIASLACTPSEKPDAPDSKPDSKPDKKQPTKKIAEHVDVGTVCISGAVDQPHEVKVDFGLCLSSSCDKLVSASCTVEQSGNELKVSGKTTIESDAGPNGICSTDCGRITPSCAAPALAAGTYTLSYAGKQKEFVVPLGEQACTER